MTHKNYVSKFGLVAALGASLMLAACGDKKEGDTASSNVAAMDLTSEVIAKAPKTEGVWGEIVFGDPNAPVTIVEYASLTCPHCAHFSNDYFPDLKEKLLDTGKAKLAFRNYIMNRVDIAASAVIRCGDEETARKLLKVYFARQNDWARASNPLDDLAALARRSGISRTEFDRCIDNGEMLTHLVSMTKEASEKFQVRSTPSFFVDGKPMEFRTFDDAMEMIEAAVEDAAK